MILSQRGEAVRCKNVEYYLFIDPHNKKTTPLSKGGRGVSLLYPLISIMPSDTNHLEKQKI